MAAPIPSKLMGKSSGGPPPAEFIGEMTVVELNQYDFNSERRLLSIFSKIFDISHRPDKYGPEGSYKEFAGVDILSGLRPVGFLWCCCHIGVIVACFIP